MEIVRCASCEGYGWYEEEDGSSADCDWCGGVGYVYRMANGLDSRIPSAEYEAVAGRLEQLETQRLRELGYTGEARKPWEQKIRRDRKTNL